MIDIEVGTNWLTRFGNRTAVDTSTITSDARCVGPWESPVNIPAHSSVYGVVTGSMLDSLFFNGHRFCRKVYVNKKLRGWFFMLRWSADPTSKYQFLQVGIGYGLNGRLKLLARLQNDVTSAAGVSGPNIGQAIGWNFGPH